MVSIFFFLFPRFRTSSTFLQPEPLQNLLELWVFAHVGQLHVHTSAQAGAQVRWTGEDVAQMFVPHEGVSSLLKQTLDLKEDQEQTLIRT